MFKYVLFALVMVMIAGAAIVRVRPIAPDAYRIADIADVTTAGVTGHFSAADGGDIAPVVINGPLPSAAAHVQNIILRTPRTTLLVGNLTPQDASPTRRTASYVTRSRVIGFPDVTTVQLDMTDEGVRVSMYARLVYGKADFGVNEARVRAWLAEIKP